MANPKAMSPFTVYQAGDGKRYAVNIPMVNQIAASCARTHAHNKFAVVKEDRMPQSLFNQNTVFKSLSFDRKAATKQFEDGYSARLGQFWRGFQASGPAAIAALAQQVKHTDMLAQELTRKHEEVSKTNNRQLEMLENRVTGARFVRDAGFAVVGALATGGATTAVAGGTGMVLSGGQFATAVFLNTGAKALGKAADLKAEGKLNTAEGGMIVVDIGADLMFAAVGGTGAVQGTKQALVFLACTKAPLEMAKTAATGGNLQQIIFSGGFEMAGPMFDIIKDGFKDALMPVIAKISVPAIIDGALELLKNQTQTILGQAPTTASPAMPAGTGRGIDSLYAMFGDYPQDPRDYFKRYVVCEMRK
jgi:hypothetical protein